MAHTADALLSPEQLSTLHSPKDLLALSNLGGLEGLERGLRTDLRSGLSAVERRIDGLRKDAELVVDQLPGPGPENTREQLTDAPFSDRKRIFLDNHLPTKRQPTFFQLLWGAYNDPVLFLLTAAAAVSLAIGLYQALATAHAPGTPRVEWVEGVAILVAVVVIVLVGSVNDWEKLRQFQKLNKKQMERDVKVIRSGVSGLIPIADVLVGDVLHLEPGDVIPADGILINGYNVMCDESSATGEGDLVHKSSGEDAFRALNEKECRQAPDPFILSGTKVLDGVGTFLVTATGINSTYGKVIASLRDEHEPTPLQVRLTAVAKYISHGGGIFALLLFVALFIKFLARLPQNTQPPAEKGKDFVDIVIIALTVLVIAVPEGLPLAVTLSLAFASTRMLKDHNLVRELKACETMGNATNICSDKTGTLTQNQMVVAACTIGSSAQFQNAIIPLPSSHSASTLVGGEMTSLEHISRRLAPDVRLILRQSIVLNSMAFEGGNGHSFVGSNTESSLLDFARLHLEMKPVKSERSAAKATQLIPFNATRQCMATVVRLSNSKLRVFIKGASEVLLAKCSKIIYNPTEGCQVTEMSEQARQQLTSNIETYAGSALRTISLAYRDLDLALDPNTSQTSTLAGEADDNAKTDFTLDYLLQDLVFLGLVGIHDALRPGVPQAVETCQKAGVTVRMITGDNIQTADAVARQCGILSDTSDVSMEGTQFRTINAEEMKQVLPHLKVLARASPQDKQKLVILLKEMGEVVAVTGDGTNDAAALSSADISFSMGGTSGTEVAREASSIILMNDDFTCITKAIMWGRVVNDSVRKFLQFQLTITITSVLLTFISAIANPNEESVLTAVQLMWVNLFQDTMAALALATDIPKPRLLDRKPEPKTAPLITIPMWKTIISQSIYQLAVTLVLYFGGARIFSYQTDAEQQQLQAMVFNTYVWLQVFNMYNDRQHDNTLNVFEGVLDNWLFMAISSIMIGAQVLIMFVGGAAFSLVPLSGTQWAISLVLGVLSIPFGALIRLVPDSPFEKVRSALERQWKSLRLRRKGPTSFD